jgi:uncharacterized protein YcfJ
MQIIGMLIAIAIVAHCFPALKSQAQVMQPSAASTRTVAELSWNLSSSRSPADTPRITRALADVASAGPIRARPIVIGVVLGALLGAGAGELVSAGGCEGLHGSTRRGVISGAWLGTAVGGLFGLVLGLPPKDH